MGLPPGLHRASAPADNPQQPSALVNVDLAYAYSSRHPDLMPTPCQRHGATLGVTPRQEPPAPAPTALLGAWIGISAARAAALTPERMELLSAVGMRWS